MGEDGVSPGQACVLYESNEGQSRILGGGWIKKAISTSASEFKEGASEASKTASEVSVS